MQRSGLKNSRVGRNGVSLLDDKNVARHDLGRRKARHVAIANHVRVGGCHLPQRRDRGLSALLLDVAENRVQQHDGADRERFVGQRGITFVPPERRRNHRGDQEQDDQHVSELGEERSPCGDRTFLGELIRSVMREPGAGIDRREAAHDIAVQRLNHLLRRLLVLGWHLATSTMMARSRVL